MTTKSHSLKEVSPEQGQGSWQEEGAEFDALEAKAGTTNQSGKAQSGAWGVRLEAEAGARVPGGRRARGGP